MSSWEIRGKMVITCTLNIIASPWRTLEPCIVRIVPVSEQADWLPHGRSQRKKGGQLLQNSKTCKFLVPACSKMKKAEPIEPIVKNSIIQGKANRQLHGRLPRNHSWETKCRRQKCQINAVEKIKALPNSVRNSSAARPPMAISNTQGRPSRSLGNRAPNIPT